MLRMPTSNLKSATTMLKKRFHIHYFNQTHPKPQLKPKKEPKNQPEKMIAHIRDPLLQPKET
jgi:hypothetical protein